KRYAALWPDDPEGAAAVLRELLGGVGEGAFLKPPLYVDYGSNLRVGARTFANYGLVALDVVSITIGDDVQIGPNVQLLTPSHPLDPELRRAKWEAGEPIVIEANVWLGGGAIVLPGVTIGRDAVVGAGGGPPRTGAARAGGDASPQPERTCGVVASAAAQRTATR